MESRSQILSEHTESTNPRSQYQTKSDNLSPQSSKLCLVLSYVLYQDSTAPSSEVIHNRTKATKWFETNEVMSQVVTDSRYQR